MDQCNSWTQFPEASLSSYVYGAVPTTVDTSANAIVPSDSADEMDVSFLGDITNEDLCNYLRSLDDASSSLQVLPADASQEMQQVKDLQHQQDEHLQHQLDQEQTERERAAIVIAAAIVAEDKAARVRSTITVAVRSSPTKLCGDPSQLKEISTLDEDQELIDLLPPSSPTLLCGDPSQPNETSTLNEDQELIDLLPPSDDGLGMPVDQTDKEYDSYDDLDDGAVSRLIPPPQSTGVEKPETPVTLQLSASTVQEPIFMEDLMTFVPLAGPVAIPAKDPGLNLDVLVKANQILSQERVQIFRLYSRKVTAKLDSSFDQYFQSQLVSMMHTGGINGTAILQSYQQHLVLLRHALWCFDSVNGCATTPHCDEMRRLWRHMARCQCSLACLYSRCTISKCLLSHFLRCTIAFCPVCKLARFPMEIQDKYSGALLVAVQATEVFKRSTGKRRQLMTPEHAGPDPKRHKL